MAISVTARNKARAKSPGDVSGKADNLLVLVGDAQRARVVRVAGASTLEVLWEGYAATHNVRGLNQAPDINHNSDDGKNVATVDTNTRFAQETSQQLRVLANARPGTRLVVIAPRSFAVALKAELGDLWPSRGGDVIYRDETMLDDGALRHFVDTRAEANG